MGTPPTLLLPVTWRSCSSCWLFHCAALQRPRLDSAMLPIKKSPRSVLALILRRWTTTPSITSSTRWPMTTSRLTSRWTRRGREAQRLEAQRLEAERLEAERLAAAQAEAAAAAAAEAERVEAARLEAARLEAARLEAARLEAA